MSYTVYTNLDLALPSNTDFSALGTLVSRARIISSRKLHSVCFVLQRAIGSGFLKLWLKDYTLMLYRRITIIGEGIRKNLRYFMGVSSDGIAIVMREGKEGEYQNFRSSVPSPP